MIQLAVVSFGCGICVGMLIMYYTSLFSFMADRQYEAFKLIYESTTKKEKNRL